MVDDKELAALIARDVFQALSEKNDKCQRLEAKGGSYPDRETTLGGFCEIALASTIQDSLRKHRSY